MATVTSRPFDDFRGAITDPEYFFGQRTFLLETQTQPFKVRYLIGASRMGKTSLLHAIQWHMLEPDSGIPRFAFPLFLDLNVERPTDLENFCYLLIARLRKAINVFTGIPGLAVRKVFKESIQQIKSGEISLLGLCKFTIDNPDRERRLNNDDFQAAFRSLQKTLENSGFQGVCILLDNADFILSKNWADDFSRYFHGLKNDVNIKDYFGLVLSGYKTLRDYKQQITSPLSAIAIEVLLEPFSNSDIQTLLNHRCRQEQIPLTEKALSFIKELAGCHPYLTHQAFNVLGDCHHNKEKPSLAELKSRVLDHCSRDFATWWPETSNPDSLGDDARAVYRALIGYQERTQEQIRNSLSLSPNNVKRMLDLLLATGVVLKREQYYKIGSQLFAAWVQEQR